MAKQIIKQLTTLPIPLNEGVHADLSTWLHYREGFSMLLMNLATQNKSASSKTVWDRQAPAKLIQQKDSKIEIQRDWEALDLLCFWIVLFVPNFCSQTAGYLVVFIYIALGPILEYNLFWMLKCRPSRICVQWCQYSHLRQVLEVSACYLSWVYYRITIRIYNTCIPIIPSRSILHIAI